MRYWVKLAGKLRGPLDAEEIVNLPGIEPHTLLCPDGQETRNRKNWRFARHFPDVRELVTKARVAGRASVDWSDERAPRSVETAPVSFEEPEEEYRPAPLAATRPGRSGWMMTTAGLALFAFLAYRTPVLRDAIQRPKPPPPPSGWQAAAEIIIPSCGQTLQDASGGSVPQVTYVEKDKYTLSWGSADPSGSEGIVMEYDETRKQIRPVTPMARKVLDFRGACKKE